MRWLAISLLLSSGGCFAIDWDYGTEPGEQKSESASGCDGEGCDAGAPPTVRCEPQDESCNGVDDDCDGKVDEGCACQGADTQACYSGPPSTQGVGECKDGVQTCEGGYWGECQSDRGPADEICNDKDDDCDGDVDEVSDLGTVTCGVGACATEAESCDSTCVPGQPAPETCDGVDNDCDGETDENNPGGGAACATGQLGVCAQGVQVCNSGVLSCSAPAPQTEICGDGDDDDCDGQVDDGCCTNVAPLATPSTSGGGGEPNYGPGRLNNGVGQVCTEWSWVENNATTPGAYFQYSWPTPTTIGSFYVDGDQATAPACGPYARDIKSAKVQYWNGAGWVTAGSLTGQADYAFTFNPPISTVALRLYDVVTSAGGGDSVIYEWKVYPTTGCGP